MTDRTTQLVINVYHSIMLAQWLDQYRWLVDDLFHQFGTKFSRVKTSSIHD